MAKIDLPKRSGKRSKVMEKSVKSQGILKTILSGNPGFPINEMDNKFGKIVIFSKQYKILEIRKCYSMALVFTFDTPEIVSPGT